MRGTASLAPASQPIPIGAFLLIFALAFMLALIASPSARWLGERSGAVAQPGGRRQHLGAISRLGAIPIFLGFVGAVIAAQFLIVEPDAGSRLPATLTVLRFDPKETIRLTGMLLGASLIFLVGLYDDWRELGPLPQYIAQLLAAGISVAFLIIIEYVNNPFSGQQTASFPYLFTVTITLFWLGLMMNTVNWLDGVDGLAAGVAAIACLVLFINGALRLDPPQHSVALLSVALMGAALGFLPFNFGRARIFLGSGAVLLGYLLGVLSIIGGAKMASILLVMGLPLLDLAWQIVSRLSRGQNPAAGDRGHLHFRLLDMGLSKQSIVLGYYAFCMVFGGLALFIPSQLYKLIAIVIMGALALIGFIWLARAQGKSSAPGPDPQ